MRGRRSIGSDTEVGETRLAPSIFWQLIRTWQQKIWSLPEFGGKFSKFPAEIEPVCSEDLFFGLHLNLGAKFRKEIQLFSLTKFHKNISPLSNLLNQQKISALMVV